ncbi:MAG: Type 1 glutamine amidotransferase-like domain-containing protein, partial [Bacteroidales bacterium]
MKSFQLFLITLFLFTVSSCQDLSHKSSDLPGPGDKTILVYGNGLHPVFIKYLAKLTNKDRAKICFLPTAAADNPRVAEYWFNLSSGISIEPSVLITFISSSPEQQSFEQQIMESDAIIVGGGNTLNMIAIWKAQGIDTLLRKAYNKGIIMAGGSAGSLCWFTGGYTDSRPQELTLMEGLGFLDFSHSPHYQNPTRKELFQKAILKGDLNSGYGCDDGAGLLFINGKMVKALSLENNCNSYFVYREYNKLVEKILPAE